MNVVEAIMVLRDAAEAHLAMLHMEEVAALTPNCDQQIAALETALAVVDKELGK